MRSSRRERPLWSRRGPATVVLACLSTLLAGCDSPGTLLAADPVGQVKPPQTRTLLATGLTIEKFDLTYTETSNGSYWYWPNVTLREVGGESSFRVLSLTFQVEGGETFSFDSSVCFLTPESREVPAGGRWTTGLVHSYCLAFDVPVNREVRVTVYYADEAGRAGFLSAIAVAAAP